MLGYSAANSYEVFIVLGAKWCLYFIERKYLYLNRKESQESVIFSYNSYTMHLIEVLCEGHWNASTDCAAIMSRGQDEGRCFWTLSATRKIGIMNFGVFFFSEYIRNLIVLLVLSILWLAFY